MSDLLDRVLAGPSTGYALLHRPESGGADTLEVILGEVRAVDTIAGLPLPAPADAAGPGHELLALIPYRQIAERGYACADDGEPLLAMTVTDQARLPLAAALDRLPDEPAALRGGAGFDLDDERYAALVAEVIGQEIGNGEGANFVLKRSFLAEIDDYGPRSALSFFRRLLQRESGAYWVFLVHTGERTFVGASPERHVSLRAGTAVMNPISGTYRYPAAGPDLPGVLDFLADAKEVDELYMVVDEELKMMARICAEGGRITGPHLKQMARLAHTEYFIEGRSDRDVRDILRETMFAPTVTGSPLESACKVIARYEPQGRGYYSGVLALIGRDGHGEREMDSAIAIRTADIDRAGRVRIGVGATLVRHSDPVAEAAETRAKAAGLLAALSQSGAARLAEHPEVRAALGRRNEGISDYWFRSRPERDRPDARLAGRQALIVDAEDTFTSMIALQLRSLGLEVTVRRFDEPYDPDRYDLLVMGPGPGDPRESEHPKIAHLEQAIARRLAQGRPMLAVCLSHQVLCRSLGLEPVRRAVPNQGVQRAVDLFGTEAHVGFYNTFAARSESDKIDHPVLGVVELSRDRSTGEIHALRGQGFASVQFHPESVLTRDGLGIVGGLLADLVGQAV